MLMFCFKMFKVHTQTFRSLYNNNTSLGSYVSRDSGLAVFAEPLEGEASEVKEVVFISPLKLFVIYENPKVQGADKKRSKPAPWTLGSSLWF